MNNGKAIWFWDISFRVEAESYDTTRSSNIIFLFIYFECKWEITIGHLWVSRNDKEIKTTAFLKRIVFTLFVLTVF